MKDIAGVLIPRGNHLNIVRRKNIGWLCLNTQCASTCVGCLPKLDAKDDVWAWDFVFDRTTAGSPIKWLSIVDEHTRECLALKADRGIGAEDVIDTLAELFAMRGVPRAIRSRPTLRVGARGPEFVAQAIQRWLAQLEIATLSIAPGSPWQNGYAERFHSHLRDEFLASELFESLVAARRLTAAWKDDYNHHRPHGSLGYMAPVEFAAGCTASAPEFPNLSWFIVKWNFNGGALASEV